jgi:hypothetical protein
MEWNHGIRTMSSFCVSLCIQMFMNEYGVENGKFFFWARNQKDQTV